MDSVAEVTAIPQEDIADPTDLSRNPYIKGIGKDGKAVKLILDCTKIFNVNTMEKISAL